MLLFLCAVWAAVITAPQKVISYSFSFPTPHIPCPHRVSGCRAGPPNKRRRCQGPFACSFISAVFFLSPSQTVWVRQELGSPSLLSQKQKKKNPFCLLSTHCLSADVARGRPGPWPSGPCVCVCHSPLLTPWRCVIGGICACLCLPVPLDAGGNRMREDQL